MKQYLAIDIGGTSVKLGLVDETGGILAKAEESVSFDGWQTPILTTVLAAAERFLTARGKDPQALEAGAFALVVGGAITRPAEITARFTGAINAAKK